MIGNELAQKNLQLRLKQFRLAGGLSFLTQWPFLTRFPIRSKQKTFLRCDPQPQVTEHLKMVNLANHESQEIKFQLTSAQAPICQKNPELQGPSEQLRVSRGFGKIWHFSSVTSEAKTPV